MTGPSLRWRWVFGSVQQASRGRTGRDVCLYYDHDPTGRRREGSLVAARAGGIVGGIA